MRIMRIPAYMENHISRLKAYEYPGTALHKIIVMVRFSPLGAISRIRNYSAELFSDDRTDVSDVRWRNVVLLVLVNAHRCWWTTHLWNFESMQSVQKSYKRCWNVETTLQILSVTAPALVVLSRGCGGMSPPQENFKIWHLKWCILAILVRWIPDRLDRWLRLCY